MSNEELKERDRIDEIVKYKVDLYYTRKTKEMVKSVNNNLTSHGKELMGKYYLEHEHRINNNEIISKIALVLGVILLVGVVIIIIL